MSRRVNASVGHNHHAVSLPGAGRRSPSPNAEGSNNRNNNNGGGVGGTARSLLDRASTTTPSRNVELCFAFTLLLVPFITLAVVYAEHSKHLDDHEQRSPVHAAVHGAAHGYQHEPGADEIGHAAKRSFRGERNGETQEQRQRRIDFLKANVAEDATHHVTKAKPRPKDALCIEEVKRALKSTWDGYVLNALGYDEVKPVTKEGYNWWEGNYPVGARTMTATVDQVDRSVTPHRITSKSIEVTATKGLGMMVIDSLDTLWLAGMKSEFEFGVQWVKLHFCPECPTERVSSFEVTIRVLGGLLSAYELSGEPALKAAAIRIGDLLYTASNEDTRRTVPRAFVRLSGPTWYDRLLRLTPWFELDNTNIVIIGSIQLEFYKLSELTGDPKYEVYAKRLMKVIFKIQNSHEESEHNAAPGLPAVKYEYDGTSLRDLSMRSGVYKRPIAPLGAHGDSFYEYLLKVFIYEAPSLSQKDRDSSEEFHTWLTSSRVMLEQSDTVRPAPYGGDSANGVDNEDYVAEWFIINRPAVSGVFTELTCFAGGLWALSSATGGAQKDLEAATAYTKTCENSRIWTRSGLPPEGVQFEHYSEEESAAHFIDTSKWGYRLRPEMIESFFYLWLLTGEPMYKQQAWDFFLAIQEELFVPETGMYTTTTDVRFRPIPKELHGDRMETFWVAETLKYMLMIFSFPAQPESLEHAKPWATAYPGGLQLPSSLCQLATASERDNQGLDPVEQCADKRRVFTTEAHPMVVKPLHQGHHGATLIKEQRDRERKEAEDSVKLERHH